LRDARGPEPVCQEHGELLALDQLLTAVTP
jgi:hypothetical protein